MDLKSFKILNYLYIILCCQSFKNTNKAFFFASVTISSSVCYDIVQEKMLNWTSKGRYFTFK